MGIAKCTDDYCHAAGLRRVGDIPDLVRRPAIGAQQKDFVFVRARSLAAVTYANHLSSARFSGGSLRTWFTWNMGNVFRLLRIRNIDDRRSVVLFLSCKRI